ncbi:hypothetical protein [Streptomyces pseudovenezuelae]|uniref:hypothetical protein n=1 Tax=Streptomyces pseudovenezuelae TaxID=67350 RepID=UPI002E8077D6|nr:hypothetical protein [Streptomyces pseudovenezuelae]WUA90170.1 hypothetical protein OHO81_24025 [Streptomyces pseudovenezuelae]
MRLRTVTLLLPVTLCLAATAACGGSDDSGDDSGPIGARQIKGVNLCALLPEDTMAKTLGVKKLEAQSSGATDDCAWKIPVDGAADGALQTGSYYLPEGGEGMTTVGGLQANRQIVQSGCQIVVTGSGATDPAATSPNAVDAVRVWYLQQGVADDEKCTRAGKLAEAIMRALPAA